MFLIIKSPRVWHLIASPAQVISKHIQINKGKNSFENLKSSKFQ